MNSLNLALIGNGRIGALIDADASIVWGCFPQFDGDPCFCALLDGNRSDDVRGIWAIDLVDRVHAEQSYVANTAVLVTRLCDRSGGEVEIVDCAPRFAQFGRLFQPMTILRRIRRITGAPRVLVRLRPLCAYGKSPPAVTLGSHDIRFVGPQLTLRLTTDASLTAVVQERPFFVEDAVTLLLGADESVTADLRDLGRHFIEATIAYWREWVRGLAIPFEWQEEVIRAAITLKLNAFDDTGAIIAAMTTSVPEAPGSGRNWDYRYCWLRDAYFVVNALNRLGATGTMEGYLRYLVEIAAGAGGGPIQPVYAINGEAALTERVEDALSGYRGIGPVRVGNDAYRQTQNDVYGAAVLAATHVFFDQRLTRRGDASLFQRLEPLGLNALAAHERPDAGIWERRNESATHTFSSVMCWAACDRLSRIARHLGLEDRSRVWRENAERIRTFVTTNCWSDRLQSYVGAVGRDELDASLLLLPELNFVNAGDPRFVATVHAIERNLKRGDFIFRYVERDDFGHPEHAFVVCTFWLVNALAAIGRRQEARTLFERLLACRNRHGLLAEHLDPMTGEAWGNFVQTYSMVGLISAAIRLSRSWDDAF
ncbi:MAG TPA: glycoside hydrolase family 15 protein [Casimicrobiaceae bacterium]|nr:glycoside hydrolase family 15 protein [Casimicrobiaceae bacterium]